MDLGDCGLGHGFLPLHYVFIRLQSSRAWYGYRAATPALRWCQAPRAGEAQSIRAEAMPLAAPLATVTCPTMYLVVSVPAT